jgi:hypothetical protein
MQQHARGVVIGAVAIVLAAVLIGAGVVALVRSPDEKLVTIAAGAMSAEDAEGEMVLSALDMVPGEHTSSTVTVINTWHRDGIVTLSMSTPDDKPRGRDDAKLSDWLDLLIYEGTTEHTPVYKGALASFRQQQLPGVLAADGPARTFVFEVTFRPGGAATAGVERAGTTVHFEWGIRAAPEVGSGS